MLLLSYELGVKNSHESILVTDVGFDFFLRVAQFLNDGLDYLLVVLDALIARLSCCFKRLLLLNDRLLLALLWPT